MAMAVDADSIRELVHHDRWPEAEGQIRKAGGTLDVAKTYHAVAKGLYWKNKNLRAAVHVMTSGIAFASTEQKGISTDDLYGVAGEVKAMNYDLASFCWPGWDEVGITIGPEELGVGRRAAAENLKLAIELKKGDAPVGNAHFMVGAYHLSDHRFTDALISFAHFRTHAAAAEDPSLTKLADGYLALTEWLSGDEEAEESFTEIVHSLRSGVDANAKFFAEQLQTAARVFRG